MHNVVQAGDAVMQTGGWSEHMLRNFDQNTFTVEWNITQ